MGNRLKVGLVGAGFMGEYHSRAYNALLRLYSDLPLSFEVAVVCDVREEAASALADRWGVPRWSPDWREVVADPDLAVIDICTPPSLHREIALAAIAAGHTVYCEKPVGLGLAQTQEMADAAKRAGVMTFVGFNYRWIPAIALARDLVHKGTIGDVVHLRISKDTDSAADATKENWRYFSDYAGAGSLGDVGSHVFDMARSLAGEFQAVSGLTRIVIPERPYQGGRRAVDTDDLWIAIATFASGATGVFQGSRVLQGNKADMTVEVYGSRGAFRWSQQRMNDLDLFETSTDGLDGFRSIRIGPQHPDHGRFVPVRGHAIGFADLKTIEAARLAEILAGDRPPGPTFDDAAAVARVIDAVPQQRWLDVTASPALTR